jgi:hypothetical protein
LAKALLFTTRWNIARANRAGCLGRLGRQIPRHRPTASTADGLGTLLGGPVAAGPNSEFWRSQLWRQVFIVSAAWLTSEGCLHAHLKTVGELNRQVVEPFHHRLGRSGGP